MVTDEINQRYIYHSYTDGLHTFEQSVYYTGMFVSMPKVQASPKLTKSSQSEIFFIHPSQAALNFVQLG